MTKLDTPPRGERAEAAKGPGAEGVDGADSPDAPPTLVAQAEAVATPAQPIAPVQSAEVDAGGEVAPRDVLEIAAQVADRILVSKPGADGSGQVRITLNESVLDGSEIQISREGGELRIVFVAQTESARRLVAENGAAFERTMGERLPDERVRIEVRTEADGGGASREEGEGRSRQQYVPDEESPDPS